MRRWHIAAYLPTEATENPYSTALSSLPEHLPLTKIKLLEVFCSAPCVFMSMKTGICRRSNCYVGAMGSNPWYSLSAPHFAPWLPYPLERILLYHLTAFHTLLLSPNPVLSRLSLRLRSMSWCVLLVFHLFSIAHFGLSAYPRQIHSCSYCWSRRHVASRQIHCRSRRHARCC